MGRDKVLPHRIFSHLDKRRTPTINIVIVGLVAFIGALILDYEKSGELINFGAFLSFMGVNIAAFWQFTVGHQGRKRNLLADAALPIFGFLFCGWIWWGLRTPAKVIGGAWFAVGLIYLALSTRGFRKAPPMLDFEGT
jgi:amino acid transporter